MRRTRPRTAVGALVAALSLLFGLLLTGCATGPATIAPSGVDGLTIPLASPDPQDFVSDIDNPWWPLRPGTRATFRDETGRELVRTVGDASVLGGLHAVPVVTAAVEASWPGAAPSPTTEWYAQDRRGNVWLVGGTTADGVSWASGTDGIGAGLVVSAVPRVGDGYVRRESGIAPDVPGWRTRVLTVGAEFDLDGQALESVTLEETPLPGEGADEQPREVELARGVGLVRVTTGDGSWLIVGLPSTGDRQRAT